MNGVTIQIQTILYKMDVESLTRSLECIKNAIRVDRMTGQVLAGVHVVHGDSSPTPCLTHEDVARFQTAYQGWFSYEYRFFNENTGTARGHNRMARTAQASHIMVMNPDVQVSPHFFGTMLGVFDRTDVSVGLVEARQVPIEHPKCYDEVTKETSWATTACVIFPKAVFDEVDGFDEKTFFLYCDDVDFSWRIRLTGHKIIYQPLAPVYHPKYLGASGYWQPSGAEEYYSAEAALLMMHKWSFDRECAQLHARLSSLKDETLRKAAAEFDRRKQAGELPAQLDPNHTVGELVKGGYGPHRYSLMV